MAEKTPTVTVIIPTYNSSGTLRLALETVLLQDFDDFEVWVVGDGCTDDSETVVTSFGDKRLHWVNLPVNSGTPAMPRNEALRRAKGRLIAYLGHDDLWFPWHLSELVDQADKSNSDFVYSLGIVLGPEGSINTFTLPERIWGVRSLGNPNNWLHRKELIETVGFWSEDIKAGVDLEFLQRVLDAKVSLGFRQQLSVLKFPSPKWRMYSLGSNYPQSPYVEAMHNNAHELRLQLLQKFASARSQTAVWPGKNTILRPLRTFIVWLVDLYGKHRWPLRNICYWRYQRNSGLSERKKRESNTRSASDTL